MVANIEKLIVGSKQRFFWDRSDEKLKDNAKMSQNLDIPYIAGMIHGKNT